jgi:single-strand DNA-binding protein
MHDTTMTVIGNVVDSPKLRRTRNGHSVANFRIASTPRRFDREKEQWVDGGTLFVTVTCWRALAENVAHSLRKGQPVVVFGRFCQREYEQGETLRTAYELEAITVGHDLTRGVAVFDKVFRTPAAADVQLDSSGIPADQSDNYLDIADEGPVSADVDLETGEVRELAPVG